MHTYLKEKCAGQAKLLTELVISLHEEGYSEDFFLMDGMICDYCQRPFAPHSFSVTRLDYFVSQKEKNRFLYVVETDTGLKGLLICEETLTSAQNNPS